jgi:hypothetical protein
MADRYYTGIGSRKTPLPILSIMERIAYRLRMDGWILRSGHAQGADQAFARGAGPDAWIFLPWPTFNSDTDYLGARVKTVPRQEAFQVAAKFHPRWDKLQPQIKPLHARNVHQVLGENLDTPSTFVIGWTPGGNGKGGTGQAYRVARGYNVPVFDLYRPDHRARIEKMLDEGGGAQ